MVLAYLLPLVFAALSGHLGSAIVPGPRSLFLFAAIGYQVFRIVQPESQRLRTVELWNTLIGLEISFIVMGLMFDWMLRQLHLPLPYPIWMVLDFAALSMLFAWRPKTVIDGQTLTVTHWTTIPQVHAFSSIQGLGWVEVRLMRAGAQVGSQHWVGLFIPGAKPIKLVREDSAEAVFHRIQQIAAYTRIPMAQRQA